MFVQWLAQTTGFNDITSLGDSGIMGAMWLWERRMSRQRETQLDEAHSRILSDRVQLEELIRVVEQNSEAMSRLTASQEQLIRELGPRLVIPRLRCGVARSGPFFGELSEAGFFKIGGSHDEVNTDVGLEGEEPGLGEGGDLRGIGDVQNNDCITFAADVREIDGFGLEGFENFAQLGVGGAVFDGGVKRGVGKFDVHHYAHGYAFRLNVREV